MTTKKPGRKHWPQEEESWVHTEAQSSPKEQRSGEWRGTWKPLLLLFCFLKIGSHVCQAGILNFGSSTSRVPGYRHGPQHPVCAALGMEPGALCMLRKHSSQGTMALGPS